MTLNDHILVRYADGLLDRDEAMEVEAALARDEIAAERVRLLKVSGAALHAEMGRMPSTSETDALVAKYLSQLARPALTAIEPRSARSVSALQVLAACMVLAFGLLAGLIIGSQPFGAKHPVWVMRVVDYHTLYSRKTVDDSQSAALDIAALEAKFQAALGQPMAIPLYAPGVMDFRRGQLLEFEREPIVQLAYLPREGTPMALCLKRAAGKDEAPQFERVHDIGMVRWRQRGIDYVLVGNQSEAELLDYSHNSVRQIAEALVRRGDR